jgi:hypothetical protein
MRRGSAHHDGLAAFLPALACAGALALSSAAAPVGAAEEAETPLDVILERAGAYVTRYGESFRNLAAEEAYRQVETRSGTAYADLAGATLSPGQVRNLRSDVVFVQLAGPIPWYTFRDVYTVDGWKVADRTGRLERLFTTASPSAHEQARALLAESTRYNLGAVDRNVNAPTIALLFLLPGNQARLVFERKGSKTIAGFQTVEVAFQESARPTLVQNREGADVPASGSFWIDPSRGTVLRTQIEYHVAQEEKSLPGGTPVSAEVLTRYRREPGLDIFVPDTMKEWYRAPSGSRIDGQARYLKYRRFQVTSEWEVTGAEKPQAQTGCVSRP